MIPLHIRDIADLICPHWHELDDEGSNEVIFAAYRIWEAGYRKGEA